jgi:hypothetical protein
VLGRLPAAVTASRWLSSDPAENARSNRSAPSLWRSWATSSASALRSVGHTAGLPGPHFEQHGGQPQRRDGACDRPPLSRKLAQRGAHEYPQPLIGSPDDHGIPYHPFTERPW